MTEKNGTRIDKNYIDS